MSFALILQHFKLETWLQWVVEEFLNVVVGQVLKAFFKTSSAFIKRAKLLVAERHVVHHQEEDKLVIWILDRLYLFEHCLRLLQEDKSLLEALLRNEVDRALVQLVDHNWNLVCKSVKFWSGAYLRRGPGLCYSVSRMSRSAPCRPCHPCRRRQSRQCLLSVTASF